jgi:hypothetical protein
MCSVHDLFIGFKKKALEYLDTVGNRQKVVEAFNISLRTLEL